MKRDVDLCRQLLMDIENQGPNCSLTTLRCGGAPVTNERIHYHLRLLIDAGFVKETERTNSGMPCVRLTNSGQESIELIRNENRWREAKWIVQEQTGGLSLTVLIVLMTKWAVDSTVRYERQQRDRHVYQPDDHQAELHQYESPYRVNAYRIEREALDKEELQPGHSHPGACKQFDVDSPLMDCERRSPCEIETADKQMSVTLPASLI